MFRDTRDFIDALRASGDLHEIEKEVHWDLELGAISRLTCEKDGPALWFKRITDYPQETAFVNPMATWRRVAVTFGLAPESSLKDIYAEYEKREGSVIPPVTVASGACKEVIKLGKDVDLFALPAPMLHDGDGGRYLGTWDMAVSYDPSTRWVNWGMYRFMVYGSRYLTGFPRPTSHLGKVFQEHYGAKNVAMPMALVIGADPMSHFTAAATYHIGGEEAALAGGLRGAPVELVRCETSDLLVPAHAEIVIECEVLPDCVGLEGPYGEYPGYRTGEMGNGILCRATAITHRQRPIVTIDATGYRDDSSTITALTGAIAIKHRLERHGVPVLSVNLPREGAVHMAIISTEYGGKQVAREIIETLTSRRALISKIFLVEPDIDVYDMGKVLHAFSTKCHPAHGMHVVHYEGRANTLTPCYSQGERALQKGASVLYDCTWPGEWSREWEVPVKATFETIFPESVRQKVLSEWKSYGFKD
jgi:4-hydroxy-3-polyprenylbenzoate decarboxylase